MASLVAMPREQADGAADASLIRKAIEYCIGEDIAQELQSGKVPRCVSINFSPQNKKLWQRLAGKSKRKRKKTNANAGEKSQKPQRPQRQPGKITLYDTGLAHAANFLRATWPVASGRPRLEFLHSLNLSNCALTDQGAQTIATIILHPSFPLRQLNLRSNLITDAGATALAEALPLPHLMMMNICRNPVHTTGISVLCDRSTETEIRVSKPEAFSHDLQEKLRWLFIA